MDPALNPNEPTLNSSLQDVLLRREQKAFDQLMRFSDNCDNLQRRLDDSNRALQQATSHCSELQIRQNLALERLRGLRKSIAE